MEITRISPDSGAVGSRVMIYSNSIDPEHSKNQVEINGTPVPILSFGSNKLVIEVSEGMSSGRVTLQVNGKVANGPYFKVLTEGPEINAVTPGRGGPGTQVTITGDHFLPPAMMAKISGDSTARTTSAKDDSLQTDIPDKIFKAKGAPSPSINGLPVSVSFGQTLAPLLSLSDTEIIAEVPGKATSSVIQLTVGDQMVTSSDFRLLRLPVINKVSPTTGPVGSEVTISGHYFSAQADSNQVRFHGIPAEITKADSTELVVTVPEKATSGPIKVQMGEQTTEGPTFTVTEGPVPQVHISGIDPKSGPVGTKVTITGQNFAADKAGNTVTFNGTEATITSASKTKLIVKVPQGTTNGPVKVTANGQIATGPSFTVTPDPDKQLAIAGLSPKKGPVGTEVTITGQNFSATKSTNTVTFNGTKAAIKTASKTKLVVTVPNGATDGPVKVQVDSQTAGGPSFDVTPAPVTHVSISDISPKSGPVGTRVTITGEHFSSDKAKNTVTFNGTQATINSASPTKLTVTVPNGATTGAVNVQVGNQTAEGPTFTVTETPVPQVAIDDISPKEGPVGTEVRISGTNFSATKAENTVTFNGTEATISSASATELVVSVPADATSGPVQVSVGSQTATGPNFNITENQAPKITSDTSFSVEENTTTVGTITASDPDGDDLTFSLSGGADGDKFTINSGSGKLVFKTAPDFENPSGTGGDNVYEVTVEASDGVLTDTQAITITVENKTGAISFRRGRILLDAGPIYDAFPLGFVFDPVPEGTDLANVRRNISIFAKAVERNLNSGGSNLSVQVNGPDASFFKFINGSIIVYAPRLEEIQFKLEFTGAAPDYENSADADADNTYEFEVTITDTRNGDAFSQEFTIPISDVQENQPPTITSPASFTVDENRTDIGTITTTDPDGDALTYSINGGDDAWAFSIDPNSGKLNFTGTPDHEKPADVNHDNTYQAQVQVTDGQETATQNLVVTVQDVAGDPSFSAGQIFVDEHPYSPINHAPNSFGIVYDDPIPDGTDLSQASGPMFNFSLTFKAPDMPASGGNFTLSGPDQDSFQIVYENYGRQSSIKLEFIGGNNGIVDYQNPQDANGDNEYVFTIIIDDGTHNPPSQQTFILPISSN